jgi:glycosyltransferase involved in cell wall biosynthesis
MQTFKAWKHVHELVEAIHYMQSKEPIEFREVAGLGIEYRYMTSEDKCKDAYFHADGTKFWDAALDNGMTHHDYWDKSQVDEFLGECRVLVDPSWSNNYSKVGGHFNRVAVDAMMRGCVVVARQKGMGSELFQSGEHYIAIPEDADAQEYADLVQYAGGIAPKTAQRMIDANREILPMFDRKTVAQRVIDLAHGEIEVEEVQGTATHAMKTKVENMLFDHFGVL